MFVSIADAEARLDDLVDLAEAGEEVILTIDGRPVVRLTPFKAQLTSADRHRVLQELMRDSAGKAVPGESAARSQDFLYDEHGLPK